MNFKPFLVALLLVVCCTREQQTALPSLSRLTVRACPAAKSSLYGDEDLMEIREVVLYAVSPQGWKRAYLQARQNHLPDTCFVFPSGMPLTVYALGNMGDATLPQDQAGQLLPEAFSYLIPENADLTASGFPLAGCLDVVTGGNASMVVHMRSLMARLVVSVDKQELSDGALESACIRVCQANRKLRPFSIDGSRAEKEEDLFSDPFDYQLFLSGETEAGITLYVPENRQGILLDSDTQQEKIPGSLSGGMDRLCTYLEYEALKQGEEDGVAGRFLYRSYLGGNETNDFSLIRGTTYRVNLSMGWDSVLNPDGWRVEGDGVTDSRRLIISDQANSLCAANQVGMLNPGDSRTLHVNFSRDSGLSWIAGGKDSDGWPYGWSLLLDGATQSGSSGCTASGIRWRCDEEGILLIEPTEEAAPHSAHTLQLVSTDGVVYSNTVSFTVGVPLELDWVSGEEPRYVAQRGLLQVSGQEDPSEELVFSAPSGSTLVRLSASGQADAVMVSLLGAGNSVVRARCSGSGQYGDFPVQALAPLLSVGALEWPCPADGGPARLDGLSPRVQYVSLEGNPLRRRIPLSGSSIVGNDLASDLYEEVLSPEATVLEGALLEAGCSNLGAVIIQVTALQRGSEVYPLVDGVRLGTVSVGACSASAGVAPLSLSVVSENPFSAFPVSVTPSEGGDIADFSPLGSAAYAQRFGFSALQHSITAPLIEGDAAWQGVEAFVGGHLDEVLSAHFSHTASTGAVAFSSVMAGRQCREAGYYTLYGYVENRHSHQRLSMPFYQGRIILHGALVAKAVGSQQQTMEVTVGYKGPEDYYAGQPLGGVFPDVGTQRTSAIYSITWEDITNGSVNHPGTCTVTVNPASRPVTQPGDWLFRVRDNCYSAHSHLETDECHACYFDGSTLDGSPMLYFLPPDGSSKYQGVSIVGDRQAVLPGGFYVLHLLQEIEGRWL